MHILQPSLLPISSSHPPIKDETAFLQVFGDHVSKICSDSSGSSTRDSGFLQKGIPSLADPSVVPSDVVKDWTSLRHPEGLIKVGCAISVLCSSYIILKSM